MAYLVFSRFDLNRKTVERIATGPGCRKAVFEHAEMAMAYAETLAASRVGRSADRPTKRKGKRKRKSEVKHKHYMDSFQVDAARAHGITKRWPMTRAAAMVANTADHAYVMEFGFDRKDKDGSVVDEVGGHFVLSDTLSWLEGFDTHRFFDDFDEPEEWDPFEHDGGSDMSYLEYH